MNLIDLNFFLRITEGRWIAIFGILFIFLAFVLPFPLYPSISLPPWFPSTWWTLQLEDAVLAEEKNSAIHELVNEMRSNNAPETWRELALKVGGLELRDRDLRGANLKRAKLPNAILSDANLQGADLTDARLPWAELENTNLQNATLIGAILFEAKLNEADLRVKNATNINLIGAHLEGATLQGKWKGAKLDGARLDSLNHDNAEFAKLDLDLTNGSFRGADLRKANLNGALLNNAILHGAVLDNTYLIGTDLTQTRMIGASLSSANLKDAILNGAMLQGVSLRGAVFESTEFRGADLTGSDLRGTKLRFAHLENARLGLADLRGVELLPPLTTSERRHLGLSPEDADNMRERPCRARAGNQQDEDCLKQWKARISPEQPCLMTKAWGPCLGESDLPKYDERLADFLATLACKDKDGAHGIMKRAQLIRQDNPERPLAELLPERLGKQDCPVLIDLRAKITALSGNVR
uniref:Uncharacterized protein YjbI, contains pentapeptide repeats n=1 Tax=Candidatus Kentrum sp. MB TaxID=2138164 RepID=A0A450XVB5_9GAMM|nr:MAG: Uncharacterized protein YjbI, contains pentapeptide repeats [Candidatus Kentron sp. MB]